MSDKDIWARDEVESPCVKLCAIHPKAQICVGCLRNLDEISNWSRLPPERRKEILQILPERASRLTQRRGGRKSRQSQ